MEDEAVGKADEEEKGHGDGGTDDAPDRLVVVKLVREGRRGRGDDDAGHDDHGAVSQTEPEPDRHRTLSLFDEPPRQIIYRGTGHASVNSFVRQ